jgi:hypothetical protein
MIRRLTLVLVIVLMVASTLTAETRSFTLLQYGSLELEVPDGWDTTIKQPGSEGGSAFQFRPSADKPIFLLVTPIPYHDGKEELAKAVRARAQLALEQFREVAVEDDLAIQELVGPHCRMLFVSATDKTVTRPSPVDFKYGSQGAAEVGGVMLTFSILSNSKDAPERDQALEIVRSARHIPPGE